MMVDKIKQILDAIAQLPPEEKQVVLSQISECRSGEAAELTPLEEQLPLDMNTIATDEKFGIQFSEDKRTLLKYNCNLRVKKYAVPSGVTTIAGHAFEGCKYLNEVVIPDGVTTIGEGAFTTCYLLSTVTIPASVTAIGMGAFNYCQCEDQVIDEHPDLYRG